MDLTSQSTPARHAARTITTEQAPRQALTRVPFKLNQFRSMPLASPLFRNTARADADKRGLDGGAADPIPSAPRTTPLAVTLSARPASLAGRASQVGPGRFAHLGPISGKPRSVSRPGRRHIERSSKGSRHPLRLACSRTAACSRLRMTAAHQFNLIGKRVSGEACGPSPSPSRRPGARPPASSA
jgi:hypothetical protein